eukprot:g2120.t1
MLVNRGPSLTRFRAHQCPLKRNTRLIRKPGVVSTLKNRNQSRSRPHLSRRAPNPTKAAFQNTQRGSGGSGGDTGGRGLGGSGDSEGGSDPSDRSGLWKGWEDRVKCDPSFPSKVLIEQIIGVGASVVGDMSYRPYWGLHELDFVFSTLIVSSIVNFALMYVLAATPASNATAAKGSIVQKLFSEQTLKNMGAPGGHMFEKGYSLTSRATNWVYKGFLFGLVGICSGLVGTAMSNGLIFLRKRVDPDFEPQNKAPNVAMNALAWGAHMSVSSNTRYQMLYGLDLIFLPRMSNSLFLVYSAAIRTLNNAFGGVSFVFFARLFRVQKVNESSIEVETA